MCWQCIANVSCRMELAQLFAMQPCFEERQELPEVPQGRTNAAMQDRVVNRLVHVDDDIAHPGSFF